MPRCSWATTEPNITYHDQEWGVPVHDDRKLFEFLILEGAQAGLSWTTILNKRENYRKAFDGFRPEKIARYGSREVKRLLADPGIVRNRLKIAATVNNAKLFLAVREEFGSFDAYLWSFVGGRPIQNRRRRMSDVPARTIESDAMSRDLLKRGFKFVGSTICYALMQATGMVNDHLVTCPRHAELGGKSQRILRAVFLAAIFGLSLAAAPLPAAEPPHQPPFRVCLDPGHPSENNDGRELLNGVREVEINWAVAQTLRKLLEEKGYVVVLTKSSVGEYVTNKRRAEIANEAAADLMLRLHADSEGPSGFTLFYPRKQSETKGIRGPSPAVIEASSRAAKVFQSAFASELRGQLQDNGIRGDEQTLIGGKQGALTGSIYSSVPILLVEMCNLAKPADAKWISEPANQQAFAKALLAGINAVAGSKAR